MSRPKLHYLPNRSYLKHFANKTGQIHILRPDGSFLTTNPGSYFKEKEFYPTEIETELSSIEGKYNVVYEEKISKQKPLTLEDKHAVSLFVASLMQRVKLQRQHLKAFSEEVCDTGREIEKTVKAKKVNPAVFVERSGNKDESSSLNDIEQILKNFGEHYSYSIMRLLPEMSRIISCMYWTFFYNNNGKPFIGSDNPFCMCSPLREKKYGKGTVGGAAGLEHADVEITLPISSKIVFFAGWQENLSDYQNATEEMIKDINFRTMRSATNLFANNKEILEEIYKKYRKK